MVSVSSTTKYGMGSGGVDWVMMVFEMKYGNGTVIRGMVIRGMVIGGTWFGLGFLIGSNNVQYCEGVLWRSGTK